MPWCGAVSVRSYTPMECLPWQCPGALPSTGRTGRPCPAHRLTRHPMGCASLSKAGWKKGIARQRHRRTVMSRTPERRAGTSAEQGGHRGVAPYARSLGTFSGARESTPPVGAGPDDLEISSAGTGPGVGQDGLSTSIRHPSLSYFKSWIWVRVFRAMSRIFTASVTVAMRV